MGAKIINARNFETTRAPSSEMHQPRNGLQGYWRMRVHTAPDAGTDAMQAAPAMAPSSSDVNVMMEWLHGAEDSRRGDLTYHRKALEAPAEAADIAFNKKERVRTHTPLTRKRRARHRHLSRVCAIVEHLRLVVNRLWGHEKVLSRGLEQNSVRLHMLFDSATIYIECAND